MGESRARASADAADFVAILLALAARHDLHIYVVTTMRSDFIGDCDAFPGLPETMNESQYLVPRLTLRQTREAIAGPARLFGRIIAPELVDTLIADMQEERDRLPVLQHALMRAWEAEEGETLGLEAYEKVGGIENGLSRHAEEAIEGLDEEGRLLTEQIFRTLTDTDPSGRQIRRPAELKEIARITQKDETEIAGIVSRFQQEGRSFLTTRPDPAGGDDLIDISHERA